MSEAGLTRWPRGPTPSSELTRARVLEFVREPEAVFWVFVFPVLLALALGIAFRTKPAGHAAGGGRRSGDAGGGAASSAAAARRPPTSTVVGTGRRRGRRGRLRTGKVDVVVGGRRSGDRQRRAAWP